MEKLGSPSHLENKTEEFTCTRAPVKSFTFLVLFLTEPKTPLSHLHTSFFRSNGQICWDHVAMEMGLSDRRGGKEIGRLNL